MVTKYVSDYANANWPMELVSLIEQLHYYNERLVDFTQAQILHGLGRGVDVQRFATDAQYKTETILGLTETLEESVYSIALSLAQRYQVPLWEVYMTHLEYLFSDSGLSTAEIEGRAQTLGLLDTLKTNPGSFYEHMTKYVYPTIEGKDLQRLLYYFTLLENCACSQFVKHAIKPDSHIKLIKKLKAVASGLDYKKLTDAQISPLEALQPILTSQNVLAISKLASRIPDINVEMLSSSSVHATWLKKTFWNGDPQLLKKAPDSGAEWSRAYDICRKYFERLNPRDLITFTDEITFSSCAATKLTVENRTEMTKKTIAAVKQFMEKQKKKGLEDSTQTCNSVTYEVAFNHLQQSLAHLGTLSHDFINHLKSTDKDSLHKYSYLYDVSRSEKEKIKELAITMCVQGESLSTIKKLLDVAVGPLGIGARDVVQYSVEKLIVSLRGNSLESCSVKQPLKVLENIVKEVHLSSERGEAIVSSDDLLEWLRPFCGDDTLPVKPRIDVLQIMEQAFNLSDDDIKLLLFFRTQAVLKASWPVKKAEVVDIENEEKRYALFLELLDISHNRTEFQHLVLLLQAWPPMKGAEM
ncbi:hypothetical protein GDO86_010442 [Hymenochirus boettgeri]|nr:hypothetical protein GDO86_010442 [Hymenochirus boettgeri]